MARATKAPIYSKIRIESRLIRTLSRRRPSEAIFVVVRSDPFRADVRASARGVVEPEEMCAEDVILGS